jgi:D-alanine-D-alanine ligase
MLPSSRREFKVLLLTDDDTLPNWTEDELYVSRRMTEVMVNGLNEQGYEIGLLPVVDDLAPLEAYDPREWVVFNWVEEFDGRPWPEAHVAEELERRGYAFTGASSQVLRFTQNRQNVKECLAAAGLPVLPSRVLRADQAGEWEEFPAIVKGLNQHASTGITGDSIVDTRQQLAARIAWLRDTLKDQALVEPFLDSREFHVAVWGNARPEAMPPVELDYTVFPDRRDRLYGADHKFDLHSHLYNELRTPCPAPADNPALRARLEQVAVEAYQATGLRDYGRLDMRLRGDEPVILDVNANPDLDPTSVHPIAADVMGLTYGQLVGGIVAFAAERLPR